MKTILHLLLGLLLLPGLWSCSKDDDNTPTPGGGNTDKKYALVIKSGGQSISLGGSFTFDAQLVGTDGSITPVTSGITYSSSASGIVSISGNTVKGEQPGTTTLTASYPFQGSTYTASVPVSVKPAASVFAVNPWTIMWEADQTEFELNPIYLGGTSIPTYTYASSDASIASVTAAGVVKVLKAGSCVITVTASLEGNPKVEVPVLVLGEPTVQLPVSQVKITPGSWEMFKGETKTFSAKAYKSDGSEVTGKTVKWSIKTTDPTGNGEAATIDQNGNVSAIRVGEATVYAEVEGIVAQATLTINPEFASMVTPFLTSLSAGETKAFTVKTYQIDKVKYRANDPNAFTEIPNPSGLQWMLPFASLPSLGSQFEILNPGPNGCTLKAKSSAMPGMTEFLIAGMLNDDNYAPGVGTISIAIGGGGNCDCGADNPQVASISVASTNVTLQAFFGSFDLNAQALNAAGSPVSGADIKYCSSNEQVATVDFSGNISGVMAGTAQITVCVGNIRKIVNVTVN
jgi:hypothetical protein